MKQLLFKYIADDSGLALHDKAIAHSPSKLEVSGPPHAKLLQGPKLSFPDWQHPKEAFLQGMNNCDPTLDPQCCLVACYAQAAFSGYVVY